jgi:hypothetical protein
MIVLKEKLLGPDIIGLLGYFLWSRGLSQSITASLCCIYKAATFPNDLHGAVLLYANETVYLHKYTIFILQKHLQNRFAGRSSGNTGLKWRELQTLLNARN